MTTIMMPDNVLRCGDSAESSLCVIESLNSPAAWWQHIRGLGDPQFQSQLTWLGQQASTGPASKRQCCQEEPASTRNGLSNAGAAATAHTSSDNSENSSGSTISIASCSCSLPDPDFPVPPAALARRRPHPNAESRSPDPEAPESRPSSPQHCSPDLRTESPCSSSPSGLSHQRQQKRVRFAVSSVDSTVIHQVAPTIHNTPAPTPSATFTHEWTGSVKHSVCGREGLLCRTTIHLPLHVPQSDLGRQLLVTKLAPRRGIQLGDHSVCRCSISDASKSQMGQLELLAKREVVVVACITGGKSLVLVPYLDKKGSLKLVCFILLL